MRDPRDVVTSEFKMRTEVYKTAWVLELSLEEYVQDRFEVRVVAPARRRYYCGNCSGGHRSTYVRARSVRRAPWFPLGEMRKRVASTEPRLSVEVRPVDSVCFVKKKGLSSLAQLITRRNAS